MTSVTSPSVILETPSLNKNRQRNPFIQFARGFSILTIVVFHYLQVTPLPALISKAVIWGGAGIHVFLFLSGYGLSLSPSTDWIAFLKRRFVKILIPYYIGIIFIAGLNSWLAIYPDGLNELMSHLLLYKMFIEPYTRSFGGHFWFISTIVQFYLIYPLLIQLIKRLGSRWSILLATTVSLSYSVLIIYLNKADLRVWNSFFLQYLWEFVLGIILARNRLLPQLLKLPLYLYLILVVAGNGITVLLAVKAGKNGQLVNDLFALIGYLSVCMTIYRVGSVLQWINKFVLWIESFSYSLYIMHMVPIGIYLRFFSYQSLTALPVVLLFVAALCLSQLFHYSTTRLMAIRYSGFYRPDTAINYPLNNLFKFFGSMRP